MTHCTSDIVFVTAFRHINRESWNHAARPFETYIEYFLTLANTIDYNLIVYIENTTLTKLVNYHFKPNIVFKNINEVHTFSDTYLENDKKIMSSDIYKNKIPDARKYNPEHVYAEYNFVNHDKIRYILETKKTYLDYVFYAWIDFGYARHLHSVPKHINTSLLPEKMIYHCIKTPNPLYKISATEMLSSCDVYITGSSFIIPSSLVKTLESLYELKINEFQEKFISDDDQSLILQVFYDNPTLFYLYQSNDWFSLYAILPK
jgi:hypothetical protein